MNSTDRKTERQLSTIHVMYGYIVDKYHLDDPFKQPQSEDGIEEYVVRYPSTGQSYAREQFKIFARAIIMVDSHLPSFNFFYGLHGPNHGLLSP